MKTALCSLFFLLAILGFGQGNLQFNQAKLITTVQTVPVGKVWKVESAQYGGGTTFVISNSGPIPIIGTMSITVNAIPIYLNPINTSGSYVYPSILSNGQSFPMWLPAGSTLATGTNTAFINVIEFNIIP